MAGESVVERHEQAVKTVTERMVEQVHALRQAVGERPFGTEKLPEREQVRRYLLLRDDPDAWTGILTDLEQGGPKRALEYAQRMEGLLTKYPDEVADWESAAGPLMRLGATEEPPA